uniref:Unkown protein n=1 Tax=Riptortus pedestris TaxID=329032 RepID=R4WR43_RIPPE|nr:unkown protein [Riptortus pedestris]
MIYSCFLHIFIFLKNHILLQCPSYVYKETSYRDLDLLSYFYLILTSKYILLQL